MKEATFTTEIMRSLRRAGVWAFKIPDAPITKELMKITRFTNAKPCDIVACVPNDLGFGQFVAIETKQIRKWRALSLKDFRPEQIEQLPLIEKKFGEAYVIINIRIKKPHENRMIVFLSATLLFERLKTKSIFAKELKSILYGSPQTIDGKIFFDLKGLIDHAKK